jgi:hypothetical protein
VHAHAFFRKEQPRRPEYAVCIGSVRKTGIIVPYTVPLNISGTATAHANVPAKTNTKQPSLSKNMANPTFFTLPKIPA